MLGRMNGWQKPEKGATRGAKMQKMQNSTLFPP
jgi:hypothetical protein